MVEKRISRALIAFGSNIGDVDENIRLALEKLTRVQYTTVINVSSVIKTDPVGGPSDQPIFSNGAVLVETKLPPLDLLHELQRIEIELLRERKVFWGPRTIDLDLILYEDKIMRTKELTLPHPRFYWRTFVLDPANEVAPTMVTPTSQTTIAETRALLYAMFAMFELASYYYQALSERRDK